MQSRVGGERKLWHDRQIHNKIGLESDERVSVCLEQPATAVVEGTTYSELTSVGSEPVAEVSEWVHS